ncbi:hypothetical protein U9M48_014417 [Paspalum notatum var. saurae]|uniref:Uncharacterized protein n=1 Tax=Paspalum notatum var. saurae TaxID=547442 RepID=A0AAQ3T1I6_PASNO
MYSASQLDSATTFCLADCQLIGLHPRKKRIPEVLFLPSTSPAISLLELLDAVAASACDHQIIHIDSNYQPFNTPSTAFIYLVLLPGLSKPWGLLHVHLLLEIAVQERRLDVHVVHFPSFLSRQRQQQPHSFDASHRCKHLIVVDAVSLCVAFHHEPRLVPHHSAVFIPLDLEHPLEANGAPAEGQLSECPSVVLLDGAQLLLHCSAPAWILLGLGKRPGLLCTHGEELPTTQFTHSIAWWCCGADDILHHPEPQWSFLVVVGVQLLIDFRRWCRKLNQRGVRPRHTRRRRWRSRLQSAIWCSRSRIHRVFLPRHHPVLDGESVLAAVVRASAGSAASRPVPLRSLVEHHVTRHVHALRHRIIGPICLGPALIPDEDHLAAAILHLLQVRRRVLDIHDAPEGLQVMYRRLLPVPGLERGLAFHRLRRHSVQEVHGSVHRLPPKPSRQPLRLEQTARGANHHRVPALDDAVLLRGVRRRQLPVHAVRRAVFHELLGCELAAPIRPERQQLAAGLCLRARLELFDGSCCSILGRQQDQPHEVGVAAWCCRRHGSAQVAVHQLQCALRPPLRLVRERRASLLSGETCLAELVHLLDGWQSADELLARHLPQRRHVDVAKPGVPPPGTLPATRCQAHRLSYLDVEPVQPVVCTRDPRQQSSSRLPNLHASSPEYTPVKERCSPFLHTKSTVPRPSISATESSPNLTEPHTAVSRSANAARDPVMWFVAPVSQIQDLASRSSFAPSCTNTFSSRRSTLPPELAAAGCRAGALEAPGPATCGGEGHDLAGDDERDVAGDTGGGGVVDLAGEGELRRSSGVALNSMSASSSWATLACSFLGLDLHSRAQWPVLPHFRH